MAVSLDTLNHDVFLNLVLYLCVSDVSALSKCNRQLRELSLSYETWVILGKSPIRSGIALSSNGFKAPDDLSPRELRDSVLKAEMINRAWTSGLARAYKTTTIMNKRDSRRLRGQAITCVMPITSDILMMQFGDEGLMIWDTASGSKLAELLSATIDLDDSVASFAMDYETKCFYCMAHYSTTSSGPYSVKLFKLDFTHLDDERESNKRLDVFQEVASFATFETYRPSASNVCFGRGQILSTKERCLCQLYIRDDIFLYIVFDWDERQAAFINTGVIPLQSHFARNYCCTLDTSNDRVILNVDMGVGVVMQYVYDVAQFTPFLKPFDDLVPEKCNINELPKVRSSHFYTLRYGYYPAFSNPLASIQPFAFQTPWHKFKGVSPPAPCTTAFIDCYDDGSPSNLDTRRLRGNIYILYPPVGLGNSTSYLTSASIANDGPERFITPSISLQYGALAWIEGRYQKIRISRFFYGSTKDVETCTPLLPDGRSIDLESGYRHDYSALSSLSLDVVHGRLFLVYDSGEVLALHFA